VTLWRAIIHIFERTSDSGRSGGISLSLSLSRSPAPSWSLRAPDRLDHRPAGDGRSRPIDRVTTESAVPAPIPTLVDRFAVSFRFSFVPVYAYPTDLTERTNERRRILSRREMFHWTPGYRGTRRRPARHRTPAGVCHSVSRPFAGYRPVPFRFSRAMIRPVRVGGP
jgi:hypothetical protein